MRIRWKLQRSWLLTDRWSKSVGGVLGPNILITDHQAEGYETNAQASLETVGQDVEDIKKQQAIMHGRVQNMEEKFDLILDIMQSRQAPVERYWNATI